MRTAIAIILIFWTCEQSSLLGNEAVQIESVVQQLDASAGGEPYTTAEILKGFPLEDAVKVITRNMAENPRFQERRIRTLAYGILSELRAETVPDGLSQFLIGLEEGYGAGGLGRLGASAPPEVIQVLGEALRKGPSEKQWSVIVALGAYGERSSAYFDDVAPVLHRTNLSPSLRKAAAEALISIGGMDKAVEQFDLAKDDHAGEELLMHLFAARGHKTRGSFNSSEDTRNAIRERVLGNLKHSNRDVRLAAMEAMVWGSHVMDIVVRDAAGRWILNPEVAVVLRDVAANDPDEEIRNKAIKGLNDDYTRFGERIERMKERISADEEPNDQ
jgi:hypothetical protein